MSEYAPMTPDEPERRMCDFDLIRKTIARNSHHHHLDDQRYEDCSQTFA